MTNKTALLARQWAEHFKADCLYDATMDELAAASEHTMATTTEPTMADVDWDDEKHYLAGAVDADGHEVVMFGTFMGTIRVCDVSEVNNEFAPVLENPGTLIPNGKRYELVEVTDEPGHPETLTTWEDFDNAPEGTVVSSPGAVPAMKNRDGRWRAVGITTPLTSGSLALGAESPATVLRWGWGE